MQIQTLTAKQYTDPDSGNTFQAVPWQIVEDGEVLIEATQSFDLSASADDIRAFLSQTLAVYKEDAARYEANQAQQEALDSAAEVAVEISNISIT